MRLLMLFLWQRTRRSKATATVAPADSDEDDGDHPGLHSHRGSLPRAQAGMLTQGWQGSVTVSSRHGSLPHRLMSMLRPNQVCLAAAGCRISFADVGMAHALCFACSSPLLNRRTGAGSSLAAAMVAS